MNCLANALLDSSRAASRVGPKMRYPRSRNASTTPSDSGSSGPTIVRLGCSTSARRTMAATSFRSTGTQRATCAMPPFPGAHTTSVTRWLRFTAHASACSRPPEPRIKTFICVPRAASVPPKLERLWSAIEGRSVKRPASLLDSMPILMRGARYAHRRRPRAYTHGRTPHQAVSATDCRGRTARTATACVSAQPGVWSDDRGCRYRDLVAVSHQSRVDISDRMVAALSSSRRQRLDWRCLFSAPLAAGKPRSRWH